MVKGTAINIFYEKTESGGYEIVREEKRYFVLEEDEDLPNDMWASETHKIEFEWGWSI